VNCAVKPVRPSFAGDTHMTKPLNGSVKIHMIYLRTSTAAHRCFGSLRIGPVWDGI
jgi:hypothetical protein